MTTVQAPGYIEIPGTHRDLCTRPVCAVLTTMACDGQPHSCLVWVDLDETTGDALVNTTLQRQHALNLATNPRVSLLIVDPDDTGRFMQVRGDAELVTDGAEAHADALARRYTRHDRFYGGVYPLAQRELETRVIVRIHARRITLDAIHA
jgi:PPOX class probable F420-dependent enzyme